MTNLFPEKAWNLPECKGATYSATGQNKILLTSTEYNTTSAVVYKLTLNKHFPTSDQELTEFLEGVTLDSDRIIGIAHWWGGMWTESLLNIYQEWITKSHHSVVAFWNGDMNECYYKVVKATNVPDDYAAFSEGCDIHHVLSGFAIAGRKWVRKLRLQNEE